MSRFFNEKYRNLEPYTPGEQPQDMEYIKLNTNESPYPPADGVVRALSSDEISKLGLYPDPEAKLLKDAIKNMYNESLQEAFAGISTKEWNSSHAADDGVVTRKKTLERDNIYVDNGSDDVLNFIFMAFAGGEKKVYFPEISYGFYSVFAELNEVKAEKIELKSDFSIYAEDYYDKKGLIVIANPNAPTGLCLTLEEIEGIVRNNSDSVVVIDEAYVDFGAETAIPLTLQYENLLVVQTFSKSRALAGGRLGFAIGNRELIADLETLKFSTNPYNINRLSMVAGIAALEENSYYMEACQKIITTRQFVTEELIKIGFDVIPSKANFIFAKTEAMSGRELYEKLKAEGVLIRHFDNPKICEYNRITIGTLEQMKAFIEKVKKILDTANAANTKERYN